TDRSVAGPIHSAAVVRIQPVDDRAKRLWESALALADELPDQGWVLVGGLMVQLHALRHGQGRIRPTVDIDILADSRQRPRSLTELVAERLIRLGYEAGEPTGLIGTPTLFTFERDGARVDVLGPDGLKTPPRTIEKHETIPVPGGTQALQRTETGTDQAV